MKIIQHFWNNLKAETDIWFFYIFLLTIPLSIRKVIFFYPIRGQFNEYSGIYLYLSDVFLLLTLFSCLIILCNKYSLLSMNTLSLVHKDKLWTRIYPQFSPRHFLAYLGTIFILWAFISVSWSNNVFISLFRSFKLLELFLLAIYVAYRIIPTAKNINCSMPACPVGRWNNLDLHLKNLTEAEVPGSNVNVPRGTFSKPEMTKTIRDIFKLIIIGGLINSFIAIWQFISQSSIGLAFLKEGLLSPDIDGVAKIVIFGNKLIRAYGLFPHPNILGGFLLLSITLTIYYYKMLYSYPLNSKCSTWNIFKLIGLEHSSNTASNVPRETFLIWRNVILTIQIVAIMLTFSKSAIFGLLITLLYITLMHWRKCSTSLAESRRAPATSENVPRLPREFKMFHVKHFKIHWDGTFNLTKIVLLTFLGLFIAISIFPNLSPIQNQSLDQREMLSNVPRGTIANNPILGIGQGQLVWSMRNNPNLLDWQFQPIHNVFLLIWSELGIVGLILFVWLLWKTLQTRFTGYSAPAPSDVPRGTSDLGWKIHAKTTSPRASKNQEVSLSANLAPQIDTPLDNVPRETLSSGLNIQSNLGIIFKGILLGFILIMLFDHYPWDIQQGQMMLWLVIGLIYGLSLTDSRKSDSVSL